MLKICSACSQGAALRTPFRLTAPPAPGRGSLSAAARKGWARAGGGWQRPHLDFRAGPRRPLPGCIRAAAGRSGDQGSSAAAGGVASCGPESDAAAPPASRRQREAVGNGGTDPAGSDAQFPSPLGFPMSGAEYSFVPVCASFQNKGRGRLQSCLPPSAMALL